MCMYMHICLCGWSMYTEYVFMYIQYSTFISTWLCNNNTISKRRLKKELCIQHSLHLPACHTFISHIVYHIKYRDTFSRTAWAKSHRLVFSVESCIYWNNYLMHCHPSSVSRYDHLTELTFFPYWGSRLVSFFIPAVYQAQETIWKTGI